EEILEWCFEKGRRPNEGDLFVWNGFASKIGWRDRLTETLVQRKEEMGITDRADIECIPDLIDFDVGRLKKPVRLGVQRLSSVRNWTFSFDGEPSNYFMCRISADSRWRIGAK